MKAPGTALVIGAVAAALATGIALAADPVPGPGSAHKVQIVKLRPLTVRLVGYKPGLTLTVRTVPPRASRKVVTEADNTTVVNLGVDGTSCLKRITSVSVWASATTRVGAVRLPIRECQSNQ